MGGTKSFIEKIKNKEVDQIGQFGVGFYSSYLVADNVKIYTKHNDDKEYIWESTSEKTYTITENDNPILTRGTRIHLRIKEDQQEFLEINNIKDIIKKYNQFINFPIEILESKEIEEEVDDEEVLENAKAQTSEKNIENTEVETSEKNIENAEAEIVETSEKNIENAEAEIVEKSEKNIENAEGGEEVNKEDHVNIEDEDDDEDDEEKEEQPKKKKVKKTITEWNIINNQKPIWCRKQNDITDEEYNTFYKTISKDYSDALAWKHFHAEGQLEFNCLLYIPERAPFNMFEQQETKKKNIKLYVKKIFIMDDCEELVPDWLRFVTGVVDSNDIPLNVSREILQQNKILKQISKTIVKKSVELFTELAEDEDKYKK